MKINVNIDREELLGVIEKEFGEGCRLICEERKRQIEMEGFDSKHDDMHESKELIMAANCYMMHPNFEEAPNNWPWENEWWKPSYDQIVQYKKASALIVAEIDRLKRLDQELF